MNDAQLDAETEAIYLALRERFARAWDEGYAQGVTDAQTAADERVVVRNPWRMA